MSQRCAIGCRAAAASDLAAASLQKVHRILKRVIRQAQARDMVGCNMAELVNTPKGRAGRPSKAPSFGRLDARMTIRSWRRSLMSCAGDRPTHQDRGGARGCHRRARRRDHLVLRVSRSSRESSAFAAHFLLAGRQ
jgi:hypothetical protein